MNVGPDSVQMASPGSYFSNRGDKIMIEQDNLHEEEEKKE